MDAAVPSRMTKRVARRWSAGAYAAFFVLFLLPFATLYAACTGERIETVNGYQTLSPHTYTYQAAADGSIKTVTTGTDGFTWIVLALVAVGIAFSIIGLRTAFLSVTSVAGLVALFLANIAAGGGSRASSKAELGFWLSEAAIAVAPAVEVRPWRRAALVALITLLAAAAVIGALIGLIALTARSSSS
jgi:hypothetical protein